MQFTKKIAAAFNNAVSYFANGESKADFDRKAGVAQGVIEFSSTVTANDEETLRASLMKTRTSALDTLLDKKIAVSLDTRLNNQVLGDRDEAIEGVYYPASKVVALRDGKSAEQASQNAVLLERLVRLLKDVTPTINVYAYTTTSVAMGGEGMAAVSQYTEWASNGNDKAPAARNNPTLKTPPLKAQGPTN